jgi:hypothetical protein
MIAKTMPPYSGERNGDEDYGYEADPQYLPPRYAIDFHTRAQVKQPRSKQRGR